MSILRSDKEQRLLKMFDRGDATAMDALYADYADYLAGVAFRYLGDDDDTKDVLQEAFIKIFTQISMFKYRGKGSLRAWLTRIVVNESLMFLRKKVHDVSLSDTEGRGWGVEAGVSDGTTVISDEPLNAEGLSASVIMGMVARLPYGYRTVFNLYVIDGLSHQQIAEQLGITAGTSASQYHKARALLARMIKAYRKDDNDYGQMD